MVTECFSFLKLHTEEKGRSQIASECSKFEIKIFAGLQLVPRGIQGLVMVFLPERLDNRGRVGEERRVDCLPFLSQLPHQRYDASM